MKTLVVGIGCRRGVSADEIDAAVRAALGTHSLDAVLAIATLDTKAAEPGLHAFCACHDFPLRTFSREQITALMSGPIAGLSHSVAACEHAGVAGVCEPCALLAAPGASLIVGKTITGRVTVAVARIANVASDGAGHAHTYQDTHQHQDIR
ncbi:cobalamin biosynthesis protein [Paraburkholderia sp.]|uniref:cobalamin biosynthesis protein n=1 Tax=Paraburkholderia sp. TaxID=1926495 RepID=UPI00238C6184|nr:cobalamin biosynthesis protein [Paraburkholderia sp.]MDE1182536.1 cobalamin biosynthesis protein [Paraburkholderia sp.]